MPWENTGEALQHVNFQLQVGSLLRTSHLGGSPSGRSFFCPLVTTWVILNVNLRLSNRAACNYGVRHAYDVLSTAVLIDAWEFWVDSKCDCAFSSWSCLLFHLFPKLISRLKISGLALKAKLCLVWEDKYCIGNYMLFLVMPILLLPART